MLPLDQFIYLYVIQRYISMHSHKVLTKQLAIQHQGNGQQYELFKRMIDASPLLYRNDFHFFNDDLTTRHFRNIAELKYIQQLIKDNKIYPGMLSTNTYNAFYPSYVLHHHYSVYLPMLNTIPQATELAKAAKVNLTTGAFFHQTKTSEMKPEKKSFPVIDQNGVIRMDHKTYFYSLVTSPYTTQAAFLSQLTKGGVALTFVNVRNQNGEFSLGVKTFDFGATISSDYLPIGYNLDGVKPCLVVPLQQKMAKVIGSTYLKQYLAEFNYSLKDLQKSLWITIKYTSMRKQFKTIDDSKEERRIITYQAVAARIIDGYSQFQALSDLYAKILTNNKAYLLYSDLLQSSHHVILENLIHLRQCCGGFGFMQYSGHPGCMERVCNRAGNESLEPLKATENYRKATQFITGSEELQKFFTQPVTNSTVGYMQFFSIFLSICHNMRESNQMTPQSFRREYLKQTSIIAMHDRQNFLRYQSQNVHCQLLQYLLYSYIIKNTKFINWSLIKIDRILFFQQLHAKKADAFHNIVKQFDSLCKTLELNYLRNTIVGRENQQEFYEELLKTSKDKNLRNSEEYRKYVREPIVEMIVEARAKI